jgi:hypothetical protein
VNSVGQRTTDDSLNREQQLEAEVAELRYIHMYDPVFLVFTISLAGGHLRLLRLTLLMLEATCSNSRKSVRRMRKH